MDRRTTFMMTKHLQQQQQRRCDNNVTVFEFVKNETCLFVSGKKGTSLTVVNLFLSDHRARSVYRIFRRRCRSV